MRASQVERVLHWRELARDRARANALLAIAVLASLVSLPAPARADDDWLALLPECAFGAEARALGRTALLYPRTGLPAVVAASDRLVTRIRVASGLTPPPGIQQPRALEGWSAELVGQGFAMADQGEHRYAVRVVDVRPDGQSTLVYRAVILLPRWAAPGTYGLRIATPGGGVAAAAGAVRVLARDEAPRVLALSDAAAREATPRALLQALATSPFDVVISRDDEALRATLEAAPLDAPLPAWLALRDVGLPAVLRVRDAALVLGACDDRHGPFEEQLEGLLAHERRTPRRLTLADLPTGGMRTLDGDTVDLHVNENEVLFLAPDLQAIDLDWARAFELSIVVPVDGLSTVVDAPEVAWYPAVDVPMIGSRPSVVARIAGPPGRAGARRERGEPLTLSVAPSARTAETRAPVRFVAETNGGEGTTVVWRLGEDDTDVGLELERRFGVLGEHEIHALAIAPDGRVARASTQVTIETREVRGCGSCDAGSGPTRLDLWLVALVLLQRGRRARNSRRKKTG